MKSEGLSGVPKDGRVPSRGNGEGEHPEDDIGESGVTVGSGLPRFDSKPSALLSALAWSRVGATLNLSPRQMEVVKAVFDDETEFSIAESLGISTHTVHTHVERIHHKLGVHDRLGLVTRVFGEFLALTLDPGSDLPPLCFNHTHGQCPLRQTDKKGKSG